MPTFLTQVLDFAQTTTHQVGDRLLTDFGQVQAQEKADGSLVTQADQWADEELRTAISGSPTIEARNAKFCVSTKTEFIHGRFPLPP